MIRIHYLFLLLTPPLLTHCGSNRDHDPDVYWRTIPEVDQVEAISSWSLVCENGANCPRNMASLKIWGGSEISWNGYSFKRSVKIGSCSGFLIDRTHVATNHHCIRSVNEYECGRELMFDFLNGQKIACKSLKSNAPHKTTTGKNEDIYGEDFAIVELAEPVEEFLLDKEISFEGFKHGEAVAVAKVNHDFTTKTAVGVVGHCRILENTHFTSYYSPTFNFFLPLFDCDRSIIPGNSGSMVLNAGGSIGAIIFASLSNGEDNKKPHSIVINGITYPETGFAVNFKCLEPLKAPFDIIWKSTPECRIDQKVLADIKSKHRFNDITISLESDASEEFENLLEDMKTNLEAENNFIRYEIQYKNVFDKSVVIQPKCFDNNKFDPEKYLLASELPTLDDEKLAFPAKLPKIILAYNTEKMFNNDYRVYPQYNKSQVDINFEIWSSKHSEISKFHDLITSSAQDRLILKDCL